ncbi:hypothetical protein [Tumebacillus flagellatus]|uniref:PRC-barrel domain-containing protein n=1 Tax=Tumebacillus flagellatus TaxID=1157490 RepID=A0A074MCN1_9BACL|nr:hypothetical protein [Tumebacillus flagellatus]KEO83612.1 hypothetical protein EL26_09375 [Tumebacillus flagellatus]
MKSSAQIQGLPIFSLIEGAEIGRVKQLVIEPSSGSVRLVLVDNDRDAVGVHVLPYDSVIGVGDFAMTVESSDSIRDLNDVAGARDLVLLGYKIIGTRVLSRQGQLMGVVHEYYVDEATGSVTACSFAEHGNTESIRVFHRDNIMTFGRDVLVIKEESRIVSTLSETAQEPAEKTATTPDPAENSAEAAETVVEASGQEVAATVADNVTPLNTAASGPYAFLIGKRLREDLTDDNGTVIAASGTEITQALIEQVKAAGPALFMKLNRLT